MKEVNGGSRSACTKIEIKAEQVIRYEAPVSRNIIVLFVQIPSKNPNQVRSTCSQNLQLHSTDRRVDGRGGREFGGGIVAGSRTMQGTPGWPSSSGRAGTSPHHAPRHRRFLLRGH